MSCPGLHAIVLNYCEPGETIGCVESLVEAGLPGDRILVVDNGSPDGSGASLERRLVDARILRLPDNRGYGAGNNAGIEWLWRSPGSRPRYVFIVNPDIRVGSETLAELTRVLKEDERRGGVTCVQYDRNRPDRLDEIFKVWLGGRDLAATELEDRTFIPTDSLLGAAMILTREALERVGGFDPLYFMYAEEADLARRLRYHGFDVGLACRAHVLHGRPYLSEDPAGRAAQRRSSQYLFILKDPSRSLGSNFVRVLGTARSYLGATLTDHGRSVRVWLKEILWFLRRARSGLAHRRREMAGPAHLSLTESVAPDEEAHPIA